MVKSVKEIPSAVTKVNLKTGEETHERMSWNILPPPADRCQVCAVKHVPEAPHNATSLYYQMTFHGMMGRWPTWADAVAHCTVETQREWELELRRMNAWSEPPNGEQPVKDHGV
jgi:hypothetical protein